MVREKSFVEFNRFDVTTTKLIWDGPAAWLMSLNDSEDVMSRLWEGAMNLQESTTYQAALWRGRNAVLTEGRIAGEKHLFVRQGTKRSGKPGAATLPPSRRVALSGGSRRWPGGSLTRMFATGPVCSA